MAEAMHRTRPDALWLDALARGAVYTFLSRALAHPTFESRQEIEDRLIPLLSSIRLPASCQRALDEALGARMAPQDVLLLAHGRIFTAVESEDCPSYETAFVSGDVFRQANTMADVSAFYRAHGLAVGGANRVRPDHIVAQLEFMGFMGRKEALAIQELRPGRVSECRKTQETFLRDHLGTWGPGFGRRLAVVAEDPFYRAVGALVAEWLELDILARGIDTLERLDTPVPHPPPDDGACGLDVDAWSAVPSVREPTEQRT
jgi:TorA maturation chaperone TorD